MKLGDRARHVGIVLIPHFTGSLLACKGAKIDRIKLCINCLVISRMKLGPVAMHEDTEYKIHYSYAE